jgi:hypothetical protein
MAYIFAHFLSFPLTHRRSAPGIAHLIGNRSSSRFQQKAGQLLCLSIGFNVDLLCVDRQIHTWAVNATVLFATVEWR